jgi:hypothetical protein
MRQKMLLMFLAVATSIGTITAQQTGDVVTIGEKRYQLTGTNLIPNPGFEDGFSGWTDGTITAEITDDNFSLSFGDGVDGSTCLHSINSTYIGGAASIATGWEIEAGKTYYFSFQVKHQDAAAAEEANAGFLKVSLTNDIANQAEPLYVLNGSKVGANGEWTKNEAAFTNSDNYGFIIARFRWLGNAFAFDNFALFEVSELPNPDALQAVITEAEATCNASGKGAAELLAAINAAKAKLTSTSIPEVEQAIVDLRTAIKVYRLANASPSSPYDAIDYIVNPSFEDGFTGWTNNGMATQTNAWQNSMKDGNTYVEKWIADTEGNNVPDVSVQQTITGLPNGSYTLTVTAQNIRQSTGAQFGGYIYAGAAKTEVGDIADYSLNFVAVDGTATIGFKTVSSTANWVACDNFRLTYYGVDLSDLKTALSALVDYANTLTGSKMQNTVFNELGAAITEATGLVMSSSATEPAITAAVLRLNNAINAAIPSIAAYASLNTAIAEAEASITEYDYLPGAADFQTAIDAAKAIYNAGNADEAAIEAAIKTLRQANLTFRLTADAPCDISWLIINADFEDDYTEFAKPNSDRAIYQPSGWTAEWQGETNDMTYVAATFTQDGASWTSYDLNAYFTRQRWAGEGSFIGLSQELPKLPSGQYRLKFQATAFGTSGDASGIAKAYVTAGGTTQETLVTVETTDPANWSEYQLDFTLNTAQVVTVGLRSTKLADNFKAGYDHFTLLLIEKLPDTGSAIESVTVDDAVVRVEYYNLQGQKVIRPVEGIYLVKKTHASNRVSVEKVIYKK